MAFKIPSVPPTTSKSVRFPNDMLEEIEEVIRGKDCTFSAFVVAAVRSALDDLKEQENEVRCTWLRHGPLRFDPSINRAHSVARE